MADKKRQHYVPRFYLKNFSINSEGKAIGIYNVEKCKFIPSGSLKSQAYENYFYGEDEKQRGQVNFSYQGWLAELEAISSYSPGRRIFSQTIGTLRFRIFCLCTCLSYYVKHFHICIS